MSTPFDFVKSASSSIANEVLNGKLEMKGFNSFVFLRSFASFEDTVLLADEINAASGMNDRYVYHSMHALVQPKKNRFSKWIKPVEEFDKNVVKRVVEQFECSTSDAKFIIEQLKEKGLLDEFIEQFNTEEKKRKK
ncbi:putative clamp loader subunit DNA polymerase accessory protein [Rhizobium phage RHph_I46]|uniref:Putative clamp loader subunit DNA polymerase accessory protein n=1 Tax=Rhizobium phage RHph_I1_9 TaxID=2509729 RepID=A0A7S5RIN1_9CAUD|nr:putative clamp loader subunit DNA polymerase accessory protein [Rhizobium phage RHph_I1_9]QIG69727.1 putative clamp loader subunit DNA polymerase accessory protein [Rhizobium phage RHph_I46]QIG71008.1 putative clamp loader subunit DNA polymerase accessory protein [Rhizobium phage RHph_I9]QIG73594.1 putative clamp loader subunit DNA polymerase accessory protein [Rhizobium phage RHph_I1_9]QIG76347.1 putative clamp loader subunit DNA polymerase accessory protein [Rhizobium phage RHph_I34]